jgi:DNA-binding CsgD family transcriptional regulator/PAS domain-containing protein
MQRESFIAPDELSSLLQLLYQEAMESPPWTRTFELLRQRLDCAHITLLIRPPYSDNLGAMVVNGVNVTEQGTASYKSHFFAVDPFVGLPPDEVLTVQELIGDEDWQRSAMYQEYLRPLGVRYLLGADIITADGLECRLRLTRSEAQSQFTEADKAFCRMLLPHLKRAIELHARLESLECERQLFAGTMNRMLVGMVTFDQDGVIIDVNEEAKSILAEKDGVRLVGNTLRADSPREHRDLQNLIRQALHEGQAQSGPGVIEAMSITRPSGRAKLGLLVRRVPLGEWTEGKQRPTLVAFLRDPEHRSMASHEILRRLFDFTRMEASLALLLVNGLSLDEAAGELGIKRNTARTHLRSIFFKTGVTRQTTLVRVVLNSVAQLG